MKPWATGQEFICLFVCALGNVKGTPLIMQETNAGGVLKLILVKNCVCFCPLNLYDSKDELEIE